MVEFWREGRRRGVSVEGGAGHWERIDLLVREEIKALKEMTYLKGP